MPRLLGIRWRLPALALTVVLATTGCVKPIDVPEFPNAEVAPERYAPLVDEEYRIAPGDRLAVRSYHDERLGQDHVVGPDGRISLLFIGNLLAAGKTPAELSAEVTRGYTRFRETEGSSVTVSVTEYADTLVYVGGEVARSGAISVRGRMTALQAIIASGGFRVTGDRRQVLILRRRDPTNIDVAKLDMADVLDGKRQDPYLRRSDIVFVPTSSIADLGDAVNLYINRIVPNAVGFNFSFVEQLDDNPADVDVNSTIDFAPNVQVAP